MNKLKELSIFYSPKELWCCRTRTLNAVSGTVEYHTHTGFITQTEAEKTLEETEAVFQKDWKNRKMSSSCFCTFTEYLEDWFEKLPSDISSTTKVKYHWIIYHLILPRIETDPPLGHIDANYLDAVIDACKEYCASAEYAVYKLLYRIATSIWLNGFLPYNLASALTPRKEPRSNVCIYTKEQTQVFLQAVKNDPYSHRLEYDLALFCGLRPGDDDDKIRLNQRKPSKYKGLRRFGPEKNLQRINKFMKERPIFYKNLIQMKENIRFYLRCFYCITKVMILQFNSENRTELARNG